MEDWITKTLDKLEDRIKESDIESGETPGELKQSKYILPIEFLSYDNLYDDKISKDYLH